MCYARMYLFLMLIERNSKIKAQARGIKIMGKSLDLELFVNSIRPKRITFRSNPITCFSKRFQV